MLREYLILILFCFMLFSGCINDGGQENSTLEKPDENVKRVLLSDGPPIPLLDDSPIPLLTEQPPPTLNVEKINLCKTKYPGTIYNSSTDKCETDLEQYCANTYRGSHYNSKTNKCDLPSGSPSGSSKVYCDPPTTTYDPSLTHQCQIDGYENWIEYCHRKYPGSDYNFGAYQCVYPNDNEYENIQKDRDCRRGAFSHYDPLTKRCEPDKV